MLPKNYNMISNKCFPITGVLQTWSTKSSYVLRENKKSEAEMQQVAPEPHSLLPVKWTASSWLQNIFQTDVRYGGQISTQWIWEKIKGTKGLLWMMIRANMGNIVKSMLTLNKFAAHQFDSKDSKPLYTDKQHSKSQRMYKIFIWSSLWLHCSVQKQPSNPHKL